jgi:hypothetical protein
MIKHATYTVSLANHYKNGKILWAREGPWTFPLTRLSAFPPTNKNLAIPAQKKKNPPSNCWLQPIFSEFRPENMDVIWAARSCFNVYWKNKSIVFVGSCHQLQSRRKLSFGLQEDLKIYLFVLDPKVERGWSITSLWICRSSDAYFEAYHILD